MKPTSFLGMCKYTTPTFKSNIVSTSKYNILTFFPKNLFEQFSKLSNLYFGTLLVLEIIYDPAPYPSLIMPIGFVVGLSMLKDVLEDMGRHRSDNDENSRQILVGNNGGEFKNIKWKDIQVGQIVKVVENQYFPCDLVLLNTSAPKGICYVETKNLDGETNLKQKSASADTIPLSLSETAVLESFKSSTIECDQPNEFLYSFQGNITIN